MSRVFYRRLLLLCLLICTINNIGYAYSNVAIKIQSQKDFDGLSGSINTALSNGAREIIVKIYPGTYYYKDNHLDMSGKFYPEASIIIKGNGATLVAQGIKHYTTDANWTLFSPENATLSQKNNIVEVWTPWYLDRKSVV